MSFWTLRKIQCWDRTSSIFHLNTHIYLNLIEFNLIICWFLWLASKTSFALAVRLFDRSLNNLIYILFVIFVLTFYIYSLNWIILILSSFYYILLILINKLWYKLSKIIETLIYTLTQVNLLSLIRVLKSMILKYLIVWRLNLLTIIQNLTGFVNFFTRLLHLKFF